MGRGRRPAHACLGFFRVIRANSWPAFFPLVLSSPFAARSGCRIYGPILCPGYVKICWTHYTRNPVPVNLHECRANNNNISEPQANAASVQCRQCIEKINEAPWRCTWTTVWSEKAYCAKESSTSTSTSKTTLTPGVFTCYS